MEIDEILGYMKIINGDMDAPAVYEGEKEVEEAFLAFVGEFGKFVDEQYMHKKDDHDFDDHDRDEFDWDELNNFMVLVDTRNTEIYGIRDYGRYSMSASDFFLRSRFLPVYMNPGYPVLDLGLISQTLGLYEDMIKEIKETAVNNGKTPLVLIRNLGFNVYQAWDFDKGRDMIVAEYKDFRDKFTVTDMATECELDNKPYFVFPPSVDMIKASRLDLYPYEWTHKMSFDEWEERAVMEVDKDLLAKIEDKKIKGIFLRGVDMVNKGRMLNLGNEVDFMKLEQRVERFVKILKFGPIEPLISDEAKLIVKAVRSIEESVPILRIKLPMNKSEK